ncbi:phosphatase PAP2 family protein [Streptomyces sp. NBC_01255]|nr:phosphatase PAP2 family protein [Streptomyces sp. NBC_01255]
MALESPRWAAALLPVAASIALSRDYTGVHYPSDVVVGAAFGVSAAFAVRGWCPRASSCRRRHGPASMHRRSPTGRG